MTINDIENEKDILMYIGTKFEEFKKLINELLKTKNIEFWHTEYSIPLFDGHRKVYGGGRTDIMYGNNEFVVPVELKYVANESSYSQLKKYIRLIKELGETRNIRGVLVCYNTTYTLRNCEIDDEVYVLELSTGKLY